MADEVIAGRYVRGKFLGRGGVGEVWLAEDQVLGRIVAIKRLRFEPTAKDGEISVDRMIREARVAARTHHPNIVALFDLVHQDDRPYLVMEYIDGESLAERIGRTGALSVDEARGLSRQVAMALDAAHSVGVVHRDVKPANIMIEHTGVAKLTDFGIARGYDDASLTDTGTTVGTIAFMAPEVAKGERATPASDVWSLGATLFDAIEGHAPFEDKTSPSMTAMLVRLISEPAPASTRSSELAPLIAQMLDADPSARPSAREVVDRLAPNIEPARSTVSVVDAPPVAPRQPEPVLTEPIHHADPEPTEPVQVPALASTTFVAPRATVASKPTLQPAAAATQLVEPPAPAPVVAPPVVAPRRRTRRAWWIGGAALVAAACVVGVVVAATPGHKSAPYQPLSAAALAGDGASGAYSTDGMNQYVVAGDAIAVIKVSTHAVRAMIPLAAGLDAIDLQVIPGGNTAVVTAAARVNGSDSTTEPGTVSFIDLHTDRVSSSVTLCGALLRRGLILAKSDTRFFVATRTCDEIFDVSLHKAIWHQMLNYDATVPPALLSDGQTVVYFDRESQPKPAQVIFYVGLDDATPTAVPTNIGLVELATGGVAVSPDGVDAYLFTRDGTESNPGSSAVLSGMVVKSQTFFPANPRPFLLQLTDAYSAVFSPNGRYLVVAGSGYNPASGVRGNAMLTIIDTALAGQLQLTSRTVKLPGKGDGSLAFSSDGNSIFVSSAISGTVSLVTLATGHIARTVTGGPWLTRSADGTMIYASSGATAHGPPTTTLIDARTGTLIGHPVSLAS